MYLQIYYYCNVLCIQLIDKFSILCFVITVASQRTPTISYISQEQIKDIGGTVELECSVQYAQDYPVLWMRVDRSRQSDGLPISTGSSLIIRDSRFSLRYDTASSTYTLQVRGLCTGILYWVSLQGNLVEAHLRVLIRLLYTGSVGLVLVDKEGCCGRAGKFLGPTFTYKWKFCVGI
jgi:hypothetical protein